MNRIALNLVALLGALALFAQEEYTAGRQIRAREAVKSYCAKMARHAAAPSGETTVLIGDLFENKENKVHNDLGGGGRLIGLQSYLVKLQLGKGKYQISFDGEEKLKQAPFWTYRDTNQDIIEERRPCLVYKARKHINGRDYDNYFIIRAVDGKIVNVFDRLPRGPFSRRPTKSPVFICAATGKQ